MAGLDPAIFFALANLCGLRALALKNNHFLTTVETEDHGGGFCSGLTVSTVVKTILFNAKIAKRRKEAIRSLRYQ
jgi:hypothetical protein